METKKNGLFSVLTNGLIKENPTLIMLLGTCPTLAVTSSMKAAVGMGLATAFVIVCSSTIIALLRKVIPNSVRLPCYIVIIAGFVTFVQLILQAYIPELYTQLGVFLSLITVNCIVFARAEAFASKNNPLTSALDGLGMGLGFTLALFIISTVRELLGAGTVLSGTPFEVTIPLEKLGAQPMLLFILPAGGFFTFGMVIAAVNVIRAKVGDARAVRDLSDCDDNCGGCPVAETCGKARV